MAVEHPPSRAIIDRDFMKRGAAILAATIGLMTAHAQPTGNPKGTATPAETSAPKAAASRGADTGASDGGKLVGNEAQTRARTQGARPPGSGTEGGLTRKNGLQSPSGDPARSDKGSATARPLPPSK